jgi:predicted HicB family RNase H-like nuclease
MTITPKKRPTQKDYEHTAVRLPPALKNELRTAAEINGRSLNAEVLARLQDNRLDAVMAELAQLRTMVQILINRG